MTNLITLHDETEEKILTLCHTLQNLSLNFRANRAEIRRVAAEVERLTTDNHP